jgi:hypothetical protein
MAAITPNFSQESCSRFAAHVTALQKPVRNVAGFVSILAKMGGRSTRVIRRIGSAIEAGKDIHTRFVRAEGAILKSQWPKPRRGGASVLLKCLFFSYLAVS